MGRLYKTICTILFLSSILGSIGMLFHPVQATTAQDPLVSRSWVENRLNEAFSPVEERLAALEQQIRAVTGQTGVNIQLQIGETTAMVNGQSVTLDAAPRIVDAGYTLVPIRFVAESLGIQVEWLAESKQIRFYHGDTELLLTVGSLAAAINGEPYTMSYPPVIDATQSQGRTLVHVRFVGEAFGCTLDWEPKGGATETVSITR